MDPIVYELFTYPGDREAAQFSAQLVGALDAGGWKQHQGGKRSLLGAGTGVRIVMRRGTDQRVQDAATTLYRALRDAEIEVYEPTLAGDLLAGVDIKLQVARKF